MRRLRKPRFFWVYPLAIGLLVTGNTSEPSLRLGIVLVLLGEALRLWANGYVGHQKINSTQKWRNDPKIGRLITAGPYAFIRHPLYVGTFLIGAGFCVVVRNVGLALAALIFFVLVYRPKAQSEEVVILEQWGEDYATYQRSVSRWFPALRPYPQRQGKWSWAGIKASKELKTLSWLIITLVVLYFREEFWQEHDLFIGRDWWKHVILTILLLGLIISDGISEYKRWSKSIRAVKE